MAEGTHAFTHAGKTYRVSRLTQERKDRFADISKAKAVATVVRTKPMLSEEEYADAYDRAMDRINSGAFDFHSDFTRKALLTPGGQLQMIGVLFDASEEDVIALLRERPDDVRAVVNLVLKESAPRPDPTGAE